MCMWGLPGPGIEPVSLALAGRFFTTEPKRKPHKLFFFFFNEYKRNVQVGDSELSVYWNYRAPPLYIKIFISPLPCADSPGGSDGKESACNAGGPALIPGSGRSPEEGNGNPLQYSCLGNPTDGGAWWATVHGVTKSRT